MVHIKDLRLHFCCVRQEQFSPEIESVVPGTIHQDEALWALPLLLPGQHSLYNLGGVWAAPMLLLLGKLSGVLSCPFLDTRASSSRSSLGVTC